MMNYFWLLLGFLLPVILTLCIMHDKRKGNYAVNAVVGGSLAIVVVNVIRRLFL